MFKTFAVRGSLIAVVAAIAVAITVGLSLNRATPAWAAGPTSNINQTCVAATNSCPNCSFAPPGALLVYTSGGSPGSGYYTGDCTPAGGVSSPIPYRSAYTGVDCGYEFRCSTNAFIQANSGVVENWCKTTTY